VDAPEPVYRQLLRRAAGRLTGQQRRLFIAEVTRALCDGNPRRSEREFGWGRQTAQQGLPELDSGIRCGEDFHARGRKRTEQQRPQLAQDIRELVEPRAQADPPFRSPLLYTRVTAVSVRQALIDPKGYRDDDLPSERTFGSILNRSIACGCGGSGARGSGPGSGGWCCGWTTGRPTPATGGCG
jgi:hypothetical protein